MPRYFTNCGPKAGPLLDRDVPGALGVYDVPDCNSGPIGMALCFTWDDQKRAVFRLIVKKAELPGRWIVVDRAFRQVEG